MEAALTVATLLFIVFFLRRWRQQRLPVPPGPKGKFLVGNVSDLPKSHGWFTYAKWAKQYDSDILYLNLAGTSFIVLDTLAAAEELFEGRSALYSSRPYSPMTFDLMGWSFNFGMMKYGPTWRQHRKFMHKSFEPPTVMKFKPHIMKTAHTLMRNMLADPDNYRYYLRHMASEVILLITYGIQIQPKDDPYVKIAERALASLTEASIPGRFLVDMFHWLKYVPEWMPFAGFKKQAKEWRKYAISTIETPYGAVRDKILEGKGVNCLVADGLRAADDQVSFDEWETVVKSVAAQIYGGASDTTVSTILSGILALMCYPDVLKKAQAEIDTVVKPGNLPDLNDLDSLPYVSALIKELWRWCSVGPMGVPHVIETEDIYKDYRIPAGSIVWANIWSMMHNEDVYPDPSTFNPERFLKDGQLNTEILDPERMVFGFGRRICPGRHFAVMSVKMVMVCIIALFDIAKPIDENGNVTEPRMEWTNALVSHPVPFKCKITPRSEKAVKAIKRTEAYEYFNE